jgi:hypothetical protein
MSVKDLAFETLAAGFALEMLDFRSRDHREAIAAFKEEGRPPVFTGIVKEPAGASHHRPFGIIRCISYL